MRQNKPNVGLKTHEGGQAAQITKEEQLTRSVLTCMLWESGFYESGQDIVLRIQDLATQCEPQFVADLARRARIDFKLRHVPLMLASTLASHKRSKHLVADLLADVIQRPDELTEFLAIYLKDTDRKKKPISAQVKKGLAAAFTKFDEYSLAKYNRDGRFKLKDILRITHPKPNDTDQEALWGRVLKDELKTPDTWEVELSQSKDQYSSWVRLLQENKLGALAMLRNLRNMEKAGVGKDIIRAGIQRIKVERVLPYRFITAARYSPHLEPDLEVKMLQCIESKEKLRGKTVLLIDVSGSMDGRMSNKSEMTNMDAACGLAILAQELCEEVEVYTFSYHLATVPNRRGFALRDAIVRSQTHGGTNLRGSLQELHQKVTYNRIIVFTDEQTHDGIAKPEGIGYLVNVAAYKNGVGYGAWRHIDGFSEAIFDYIIETEKVDQGREI